ncbi:MAG: 4-hydroxythreonine-4-phosphate dehydrogenase PdxA [Planctomycetota bacterium]
MDPANRPLLALTAGDPAGIGPEIVLAALRDPRVRSVSRLAVIGPRSLRPADVPLVTPEALGERSDAVWLDSAAGAEEEPWVLGRPQASGGRAALRALRLGAELARSGAVDGLVTAPVSKEALHLAGERVEGQTQLLGRWAGTEDVEMLAVVRRLRVLLLTRHLPLRDAIASIEPGRVLERLRLFDEGLRWLGVERPRIALAGLNPHAGENGILGSEENELLAPAVAAARDEGLVVAGPESPDTVFLHGLQGRYDGVLALYHDQAFLPVKIAAPGEALTVLLGLPYLRVSPAHGTAFDIAGTGRADPGSLIHALCEAARLAGAVRYPSASAPPA